MNLNKAEEVPLRLQQEIRLVKVGVILVQGLGECRGGSGSGFHEGVGLAEPVGSDLRSFCRRTTRSIMFNDIGFTRTEFSKSAKTQ